MSDSYTPKTEAVFGEWLESRVWLSKLETGVADDVARVEFDRWLTNVQAKVWDEATSAALNYLEGPDWADPTKNPYAESEDGGENK